MSWAANAVLAGAAAAVRTARQAMPRSTINRVARMPRTPVVRVIEAPLPAKGHVAGAANATMARRSPWPYVNRARLWPPLLGGRQLEPGSRDGRPGGSRRGRPALAE